MDETRNQDQYLDMRDRQQTQVDTQLQEHQDTMDRLYGVFQREWAENPVTAGKGQGVLHTIYPNISFAELGTSVVQW